MGTAAWVETSTCLVCACAVGIFVEVTFLEVTFAEEIGAWNPGAESLNAAGVASQTDRGP